MFISDFVNSDLRKTSFEKTKEKFEALKAANNTSLANLLELYLSEKSKGALNYSRCILRNQGIVYKTLKYDLKLAIKNKSLLQDKLAVYGEIYKNRLLHKEEVLKVVEELSESDSESIFNPALGLNQALQEVFQMMELERSEAIRIIAKTLLRKNKENVLEYINKVEHSLTLKYITKDSEGM
ncbi:hypothetical protein NEOKW01_1685 [Nematocida sp. AWRm80]|nr:hypothetical protein NEOKW01_1685 [Nematocida sp. AWRm80]